MKKQKDNIMNKKKEEINNLIKKKEKLMKNI